MTDWIVRLDPSAAINSRVELDLNSRAFAVEQKGIDWGDAMVAQQFDQQRYGEVPISSRIPNRTVTIPMAIGAESGATVAEEEEARGQLQKKVALIQREGGVLLRQREGGRPLYADIVDASVNIPDVWGETASVEPNVVLKLICLPDFYSEWQELDSIEGTGQIVAPLETSHELAVIKGDYPARTRIVLTEKSGQDQKGLIWGFRYRHYDPSETARLYYDAREMTSLNGAREVVEPEAYSGRAIKLEAAEPAWLPFLTTDLAAGARHLTHLGSYRVWVRVLAGIGASPPMLRVAWSTGDATSVTINPAAQAWLGVTSFSGPSSETFRLLDLGEIRLDEPPVGEHWWRGVLQFSNPNEDESSILVDRIWLQPIDDGAGRLRATAQPSAQLVAPARKPQFAASSNSLHAGKAWTPIPPEGERSAGGTVSFNEELSPVLEPTAALALTRCGFLVGAAVYGIAVTVTWRAAHGPRGFAVRTPHVALIRDGALTGARIAASGATLGGPSDLWATTWAPIQVNAEGFGVAIWSVASGEGTIEVQDVELTVYSSTLPGPLSDAVLYANRKAEVRFDGVMREDTASGAYVGVSQVLGDLPRIPPSGLENRVVELFVKNSRGQLDATHADSGKDAIAAKILYAPTYLGRI